MVLPADLHWFELDQADVVAAKQKLLGELAAEVPPQGDGRESDEAQQPGTPGQSGLARHLRSGRHCGLMGADSRCACGAAD